MHPKVARIRQLMDDGFDLENIDSDHGAVEVHLRREDLRLSIRLLPNEAKTYLYGRQLRV